MSEIKEIKGTVYRVGETESIGANGFTKRKIVIETPDDKYPQKIEVEAHKDKTSIFDVLNIGDTVTANVNLRSNEWKDRFFLSLVCWKIAVDSAAAKTGQTPDINEDIPF